MTPKGSSTFCPTPAIRKSDLGKSVNITSLIRRGDQRVRCGFFGKLDDIIVDYQLNSHKKVLALTVVRTSPIETYNLRLHYRVRPGKEWSKRIEVDSMPVNLIDISLGGTLFSHSNENPIEYGQEIQVVYTDNDGNRHIIPSTVKRVSFRVKKLAEFFFYFISNVFQIIIALHRL